MYNYTEHRTTSKYPIAIAPHNYKLRHLAIM